MVTVAVNRVDAVKGAAGVKVAVLPEAVTVPVIAVVPGPVKVKVVALMVEASRAVLNVAVTTVVRETAVAVSAGAVETTVGAAGGGGGGVLDPPPPQAAAKELKSARRRIEDRLITSLIEDFLVALFAVTNIPHEETSGQT